MLDELFADTPKPRHPIGVNSGAAMTVTGPVPVEDLGVTLMHEHIFLDGARSWICPCHPDEKAIAEQKVSIEIIGELRMNPYMNRDNVSIDDGDLALGQLKRFQALGGCAGLEQFDRYKQLKLLQDADLIVAECSTLVEQHGLDRNVARDVVTRAMLGDQPLALKASV